MLKLPLFQSLKSVSKLSIAFVSCLILLSFSIENEANNRIKWTENYKLTWSDFKGKNIKNSLLSAETNSGIHFNYRCTGSKMEYEIYSYFDKSESWNKPNASDYVLNHEQLHFDITELYARKMRQRFDKIKNPCSKSKFELQAVFSEVMKEHRSYQNQYDRETKHSINETQQQQWQEKVAKELKELEGYKL